MSIIWFRRGLRLHDNPALLAAIEHARKTSCALYPVFALDRVLLTDRYVGDVRLHFLVESLHDLDEGLRERGSRLLVLPASDDTVSTLISFAQRVRATSITFELDVEPFARARDRRLRDEARRLNIAVRRFGSLTLHDPRKLTRLCEGRAPLSYSGFLALFERAGEPPKPLGAPPVNASLPSIGSVARDEFLPPASAQAIRPSAIVSSSSTSSTSSSSLPSASTAKLLRGGERAALALMHSRLASMDVVKFAKPDTNAAASIERPSTTCLSPYVKFGCLSARTFYWHLRELERAAPKKEQITKPPVSLVGQLLWREHFYNVGAHVGSALASVANNPICRQIEWRDAARDAEARAHLQAWTDGRTGYPFVDAAMRQLRATGYLHHLARHSVACFLTRGDLYVSWTEGAAVFERELVDADWCLNNCNWMWLSASAFFHQYHRVYSPIAFPKKYGEQARAMVRRWCPELASVPDKYLFEPWLSASPPKSYPKPIVDHAVASKVNLDKMNQAYKRASARETTSVGIAEPWSDDEDDDDARTAQPASKKQRKSTSTTTADADDDC